MADRSERGRAQTSLGVCGGGAAQGRRVPEWCGQSAAARPHVADLKCEADVRNDFGRRGGCAAGSARARRCTRPTARRPDVPGGRPPRPRLLRPATPHSRPSRSLLPLHASRAGPRAPARPARFPLPSPGRDGMRCARATAPTIGPSRSCVRALWFLSLQLPCSRPSPPARPPWRRALRWRPLAPPRAAPRAPPCRRVPLPVRRRPRMRSTCRFCGVHATQSDAPTFWRRVAARPTRRGGEHARRERPARRERGWSERGLPLAFSPRSPVPFAARTMFQQDLPLNEADPEIFDLIRNEKNRQVRKGRSGGSSMRGAERHARSSSSKGGGGREGR